MAAGRLEVEVTANTAKLDAKLGQVEGQLKKTGKSLDEEMGTPLGKAAVKAGKLFAAMGAIEGATKVASGAMSGFSGLMASIEGDSEAAERHFAVLAETAKSLPFGIGPVVAAFEQILHSASGLNEALAEQEEMLVRIADLDRQIAEARTRKSVITSLETQIKLAKERDANNRAFIQYSATFAQILQEHEDRLSDSVGKTRKERERIRKDSERTFELQRELARLQRRAVTEAEDERKRLEAIRKEEQQRLVVKKKQAEEAREQLRIEREMEREQRSRLNEAKKAAAALVAEEDKRKGMEEAAARATSTAQTAFGTFTFGQVRQGGGQEKANSHLQGIEEGIEALKQILNVGLRGIGFM